MNLDDLIAKGAKARQERKANKTQAKKGLKKSKQTQAEQIAARKLASQQARERWLTQVGRIPKWKALSKVFLGEHRNCACGHQQTILSPEPLVEFILLSKPSTKHLLAGHPSVDNPLIPTRIDLKVVDVQHCINCVDATSTNIENETHLVKSPQLEEIA